jgi:hypothetical protein
LKTLLSAAPSLRPPVTLKMLEPSSPVESPSTTLNSMDTPSTSMRLGAAPNTPSEKRREPSPS